MAAVSVLGGALGAFLLLSTPQSMFNLLLPWLLLVGSLTFSFGRKAGEWLRQRVRIGPNTMLAAQFLLGVYGGYFGGAVGIMMLATWSLITTADLGSMQASRNVLNAAMNATASLIFIFGGLVYWPQMFALMAGALVGGYGAAWFATRLDPAKARVGISIMTGLITLLFFWKTYFA
jgi:hypothetical protein